MSILKSVIIVSEPKPINKMTTKDKLEKIQFDFLVADIERNNQTLQEKINEMDLLIKK